MDQYLNQSIFVTNYMYYLVTAKPRSAKEAEFNSLMFGEMMFTTAKCWTMGMTLGFLSKFRSIHSRYSSYVKVMMFLSTFGIFVSFPLNYHKYKTITLDHMRSLDREEADDKP